MFDFGIQMPRTIKLSWFKFFKKIPTMFFSAETNLMVSFGHVLPKTF